MKVLTCILALAVVAKGAPTPEPHYTFPNIIGTSAWADVRQWTGYEGNGPVLDVSSTDIRCNKNGDKNFAKGTTTIAAGSTTGFNANQAIFHYGPALAYLAKVPAGKTAATWDGSGQAWFKIYEEHPTVANNQLQWPSYNAMKINFKIPAATPPGEYLLRVEHIAMHLANQLNGAQFYISCAQVTITGNGAGTPGPLVAFPGAYKNTDPGIHYNINPPVKNDYQPPGPAIWTG